MGITVFIIITCHSESCLSSIYRAFLLGPQSAVTQGLAGLSAACPAYPPPNPEHHSSVRPLPLPRLPSGVGIRITICSQVVISCCLPNEAPRRKDRRQARTEIDLRAGRELRKVSLCRCCCQRRVLSVLKLQQAAGRCLRMPFSWGLSPAGAHPAVASDSCAILHQPLEKPAASTPFRSCVCVSSFISENGFHHADVSPSRDGADTGRPRWGLIAQMLVAR